jgi:type 1 fimbriae regulatory protein FimB
MKMGVDRHGRRERSREYLTPGEITKLLAAAGSKDVTRNPERDYCLLLLMYRHGLRVSEACQLKVSDVDLAEKSINVRRLKNGISTRQPLYAGETKAIRAWLKVREGMSADNTETLFLSEQRQPLSRATVNLIVANAARAAGLKHLAVHPHMLRHSCGYWLANRGADSRLIQEFLGHARLENSARYMAVNRVRFAGLF